MKDYAARGQLTLLETPALQGAPIEHVSTPARDDGDIPRPFTVENPDSHLRGDTTVVGPIHQIPAHCSSIQIHIVHNKNGCISRSRYQRHRLCCINEAISRCIFCDCSV